jgi:putative FmdB family regulatory protein
MPIFEYTCNACDEMFALLQWTTEEKETLCPKCGSKDVKKVLSSFSCSSDSGSSSGGSHSGFGGGG